MEASLPRVPGSSKGSPLLPPGCVPGEQQLLCETELTLVLALWYRERSPCLGALAVAFLTLTWTAHLEASLVCFKSVNVSLRGSSGCSWLCKPWGTSLHGLSLSQTGPHCVSLCFSFPTSVCGCKNSSLSKYVLLIFNNSFFYSDMFCYSDTRNFSVTA